MAKVKDEQKKEESPEVKTPSEKIPDGLPTMEKHIDKNLLFLNMQVAQLAKLREPFEDGQVLQKPQPMVPSEEYKKLPKGICNICGGYHATSKTTHLSYVGHAALTDRFLKVDPFWNWEPLSVNEKGLPLIENGGLWIKLTLCGVTRLGYGDAQGKVDTKGNITHNGIKEIIGDALRNAGMRFGCAIDLWHKGDLNPETDEPLPQSFSELPEIAEIKKCTTQEQLKKVFAEAYTKHKENADRAALTKVYNEIKTNIINEEKRLKAEVVE